MILFIEKSHRVDDVVLLGIDGEGRVGEHHPALHREVAEPPPDGVYRFLQALLLLRFCHIGKQGELHTVQQHQVCRPHPQTAYRQAAFVVLFVKGVKAASNSSWVMQLGRLREVCRSKL